MIPACKTRGIRTSGAPILSPSLLNTKIRGINSYPPRLPECILMMDENLTITYANAEFFGIEELKEEDIVGKDIRNCSLSLLPADIIPFISRVTPGLVTEREYLVPLASGNRLIKVKVVGTFLDGTKPGIIVFLNDTLWE